MDRMVGFPVKNSTDYIADIDVEEIDFDKSDDSNEIETQDCSDSVSFSYYSAKQWVLACRGWQCPHRFLSIFIVFYLLAFLSVWYKFANYLKPTSR